MLEAEKHIWKSDSYILMRLPCSWQSYKYAAPTFHKAGRSAHSQDVPNNPYSDFPKDCPFFLERKDSCID